MGVCGGRILIPRTEGEERSGRAGFSLLLVRGDKGGLARDMELGEAPEKPRRRVLREKTGVPR